MAAKNSTIGTFLELWEHFRGSIFVASQLLIMKYWFSHFPLFFFKKNNETIIFKRSIQWGVVCKSNLLGGLFVTAARKIFSKSFRKVPVTKFAQELFDRGYLNSLFFLQVFSLPKWRNQAISLCEITSNKLSF